MPMKMSGNAKSDTMRARSRSSLMRSRCASVRTAATSLTDFPHDLEIRVLEARHVRTHERQRRVDRLERGVRVARVDVDAERPAAVAAQLEAGELAAQPPAVLGIDEDVLLHQVGLDALRGAERDHLALVDDADRVGLLGLLEIVRREEDRGAALAPDRAEVFPQRPAARYVEARGRLVEEEDLGAMHEAADDLELASHAARERPHRLLQLACDAEQRGQTLHLLAVRRGHESVARRVRIEAVEDGMEAHVLLGR